MNHFARLIGSDFTGNIIDLIGIIIAIIGLKIGVNKVTDFIESFNNKKFDALFGYYTNLRTYIKQLRHLTVNNNNAPLGTIYKLSPVEKLRESGQPGHVFDDKLKSLSSDILQYLSTAHEQIPAINTHQEFEVWDKKFIALVDMLNWFSTINESYIPSLTSEEEIKKYSQEIVDVFEYFENMMKLESDNLSIKITRKQKLKKMGNL